MKKQDSVDGEVLTDFFSKNMENKKFKSLYTGDEHDLTKDEKGKYIYSVEKQSYQYGSAMCEYAIQKEVVGSYKFEADSSHSLVLLENKALLNADSLSESEVKECYDVGTFVEVRKVEVNDSGEIEVRYEDGNGVLNILSPM